jgi:DNA-binding response OmpR family regulator
MHERPDEVGPVPLQESTGPHPVGSPLVRVALVDSDSGFIRVLSRRIGAIGWRLETLANAPSVERLRGRRLDAVVIDPALLGSDAWPFLERLCAERAAPVTIVCTGPSSVAQRVRGLRLGIDDWLTKPCHPEELLARLEAALRRRGAGGASADAPVATVAGELEIRPEMFEAFVGGRPVGLTRREFELLQLLAGGGGKVVPREQIYERVWGYAMAHGDRSVDVFVRRVRKKLETASPAWRYLHTHFGVGYRFEAQEGSEDVEEEGSPTTLPPT